MRLRSAPLIAALVIGLATPTVARSQNVVEVTKDILDRFLRGASAEKSEEDKVGSQLSDIDSKIAAYRKCKADFEAAGEASGSRLGGFAAKLAIRRKCGSTSDEDLMKDRQKITEGPENAAAKESGMKLADYRGLKDRISGWLRGDTGGFSKSSLDVLSARRSELSSSLGVSVAQAGAPGGGAAMGMSGGGGRMVNMPSVWSQDYAWTYIGALFAMQYSSGATMFEKEYQPGQWTTWEITDPNEPDAKQTIERSFLGKTADGGEWWHMKTTFVQKSDGKDVADTVVLEALFKPQGDQMMQLVRMRGKLPGNPDAQELMVPQWMTMVRTGGLFPNKPTPESIEGATVGTESVSAGSKTVQAKHVRYGAGRGNIDWWLSDDVPGGWVKFTGASDDRDKTATYVMQMTGSGTGAKSELGIKF